MASPVYDRISHDADTLPSDEQLRLIAHLAQRLAVAGIASSEKNQPRWEDFSGSVPSPMCGEDAQDWVTRTRQESDERSVAP